MNAILTNRGAEIDYDLYRGLYGQNEISKIKSDLTVTEETQYKNVIRKKLTAYKTTDTKIIVPPGYAKKLKKDGKIDNFRIVDNRLNNLQRVNFGNLTCVLYDYQQAVINYLKNEHLTIPHGILFERVIVRMDTGLGKTVLGVAIIKEVKLPALVVAHNRNLQCEWIKTINDFLPDGKVQKYKNETNYQINNTNCSILVGVVNTIAKKPPEFFEQFGLIIMDEIDDYCSKIKSGVFWAQAPYVIGLTATLGEAPNGLDKILYKWRPETLAEKRGTKDVVEKPRYFDQIIETENIPGFNIGAAKYQFHIKIINYKGAAKYTETQYNTADTKAPNLTNALICTDPHRNNMVMEEVEYYLNLHNTREAERYGLFEDNKIGVLILAEHRNAIFTLYELLKEKYKEHLLAPEIEDSGQVIVGGEGANDRVQRAKTCRLVLCTYAYGSRGLNLKHMHVLIRYTSRRSRNRQIRGRITRRGSDPRIHRHIIDIVDINTILRPQFNKRVKLYNEMVECDEAEITYVDVENT
jgi:superfamily II DNA or RNA helicase